MGDHSRQLIKDLEAKTRLFRREILEMTFKAGSGHPGGSLSAVDIITVLYYHQMRVDPKNPKWADRDRFVLSKGHVCPALYAILAEIGFFPKEALWTLRRPESILQGHPDMRLTPGVEMSTGSLGQGLSVACGMALAARLDEKDYAVYCMLGDGEVQEGNVWEGAMFATHERLDNLIAILDRNRLQIEGFTEDVMTLDPLEDKWKAFGWTVLELEDGNDIKQILTVLDKAVERQGKPKIIIANTIKG
ncbi:MAG: transketolase, partial [Candidatus Bathyarchaeota archaeon]|nr:transketolase [Candidatus Bathyarchaeota archaeon]